MIPNARHGYGAASNYMMRRRWDYFVRYLLGVEPPHEYEIVTTPYDTKERSGGMVKLELELRGPNFFGTNAVSTSFMSRSDEPGIDRYFVVDFGSKLGLTKLRLQAFSPRMLTLKAHSS